MTYYTSRRLPAIIAGIVRVTVVDPAAYTPPYDHALCSALADRGMAVELVTTRFTHGSLPQPKNYERLQFFYRAANVIENRRARRWARLLEHPFDMARFVRRLARSDADVVHFQWLPVQPVDLRALKRIEVPLVVTAHDGLPREPRLGQREAAAEIYRLADAVIVHSEFGRRALVEGLGLAEQSVHVIAHGAFTHLAELPPAEIDFQRTNNEPVVLFFGLLRPYKGIETLIDAFAKTSTSSRLLIVGMPRMPTAPLRERIERLGIGNRVSLVQRFVEEDELAAYFRLADLVVLPYREIDQSGVLFTALAFHKPTVVSDLGGLGEIARKHGAAAAVPPGDSSALAAAIERLLGDPNERRALAERSATAADGPFAWETIAAQTEALYRSLV